MDVTFPAARQLQILTSDLLENHGAQSRSQNTRGALLTGTFYRSQNSQIVMAECGWGGMKNAGKLSLLAFLIFAKSIFNCQTVNQLYAAGNAAINFNASGSGTATP